MTQKQQDRAKILLKATLDILNKCDEGVSVKNVMEVTAFWDDANCDGECLKDDISDLMYEIKQIK